jgi:hypothetical protein
MRWILVEWQQGGVFVLPENLVQKDPAICKRGTYDLKEYRVLEVFDSLEEAQAMRRLLIGGSND